MTKSLPNKQLLRNSWISPEGLVFPCPPQKHLEWAKKLGQDFLDLYIDFNSAPDHILMLRGWIKISNGRFFYYHRRLKSQILIDRVFDLISTLKPAELVINSTRYEDFSQWLQTIHT